MQKGVDVCLFARVTVDDIHCNEANCNVPRLKQMESWAPVSEILGQLTG